MNTLNKGFRRLFGGGAGLAMALVFLIIFVNSVRRYAVGRSVPWGEELPIYLSIYGVMFGLAYAYLTDSHIRFTIIIDMLPEKVRRVLFIVTDAATVVAGLALAWSGHLFALRRGGTDASGLIGTARGLAETTGLDWLVWLGKLGTWQYAIAFGGLALAIAASLKLAERLGAGGKDFT